MKPIVFAIFDVKDVDAVQAWFTQHEDNYLLDKPSLIQGDRLWLHGVSYEYVLAQNDVTEKIKRNLNGGVVGASHIPTGMPKLSR